MKKLLFILITSTIIFGCNKDKSISEQMSGETWAVVEMSINGEKQSELPILTFFECDIYDESCYASWEVENTKSNFIWQFRDDAKTFEISNQSQLTNALELAIRQCMNYSGVYKVTDESETSLTVKSSITLGYEGKEVIIKMKKQ